MNSKGLRILAPAALTVMLMAGVVIEQPQRTPPATVEPYHAELRAMADGFQHEADQWISEKVELPQAAVALLSPNFSFSRLYTHASSGTVARVIMVQCRDARDMLGHYPPVCYPGQGWMLQEKFPRHWSVPPLEINGMEYQFQNRVVGESKRLTVSNFLILPNGRFTNEMRDVRDLAAHFPERYFGAAQMQLIVDSSLPAAEREKIVKSLLEIYVPLIQKIGSRPSL
jgi:hypothetical protein